MPLEKSATAVFGDDPRLKPVSMGLFPTGGTRGNVSPGQFKQLDNNYMKRAEQILQHKDRVATLRDKEQARVQGSQAIGLIQGLDPKDPNYLTNRNDIISRYPKASLDAAANSFLDMQEDVYAQTEHERRRTLLADEANQRQLDAEERRATSQAEYDTAREGRALSDDVRKLSGASQESYYASIASGIDPALAYSVAQSMSDRANQVNDYLSKGGDKNLLFDEKTGQPRTEREIATMTGQFVVDKRELDAKKFKAEQMEDQLDSTRDQIKAATERLIYVPGSDVASKELAQKELARLQHNADSLNQQLANLRDISFGDQGASLPEVSTPEGSPADNSRVSAVSGEAIPNRGADFVKPRN